jgi:hypothetical protein
VNGMKLGYAGGHVEGHVGGWDNVYHFWGDFRPRMYM